MANERNERESAVAPIEGEFQEKVVAINRVAKVVKGGRRFGFNALVVVGNGAGKVGIGSGKANDVSEAIRKGTENARKHVVEIPLHKHTIPHETFSKFGAAKIILKPASEGTGVIAGGAARAVLELAGVRNILTKLLGSTNPHNVVKATLKGLRSVRLRKDYEELRR
ncbi:MAG: 30S ribosomal protein S5 [Fibrobacteres bacterium]|nr:30S ribosomal protein S5 [Fibrobacterota bacterium]MBK9577869.1 30S ribosomal protein S5 [Fibrobacterota bacterium]QQS06870.1 MAG: 30S ribosomal protein S5 [Fibrobacterota bacterium]